MTRRLVLGASASGKSAFAESLFGPHSEVLYVATAVQREDDDEWSRRIQRHRERRPRRWASVETGDVAAVLAAPGPAVLIDSMTTWLARTMDDCGCWGGERAGALDAGIDRLVVGWQTTTREVVAVSDEVGLGIVPDTYSGRRFRDALGRLNQRLAAAADEVHLVIAGLPVRLK